MQWIFFKLSSCFSKQFFLPRTMSPFIDSNRSQANLTSHLAKSHHHKNQIDTAVQLSFKLPFLVPVYANHLRRVRTAEQSGPVCDGAI